AIFSYFTLQSNQFSIKINISFLCFSGADTEGVKPFFFRCREAFSLSLQKYEKNPIPAILSINIWIEKKVGWGSF
ncbi:MAG: hypothetical protein PUI10_05035, partial [Prevotellaceae bacterium]|nr:hypothetical protein [Prevotellaceae bacterium]